jgi:hypothetical protein
MERSINAGSNRQTCPVLFARVVGFKFIFRRGATQGSIEREKNARLRQFGQPLSNQIILVSLANAVSVFQSRFF